MKFAPLARLLAAAAITAAFAAPASAAYSGLYIFGDSLSDSGNAAALVGTDPTQVITGNSYNPSRPYASGTFTNGNTWVNSFAAGVGLPAFATASLAGGGDFAIGGARTATGATSVDAQSQLFLSGTGGIAPSTALYVVAAGGNDARDALVAAATSATPNTVIATAAATYAQNVGNIVDRLQAAGARDIVVWDVPNLALAPAVTSQGAGATFLGGLVSQAFNSALNARMASEGVRVFSVYNLVSGVVANPAAYGLTNVTDACGAPSLACNSSLNTALFWDSLHPTARGHQIIAQGMLAAVPEPSTALMLAAGAAVLALSRRRRAA